VNKIHFFKRKEIDDTKWNGLIAGAFNSLPYALTWYLDAVAENWGALVLNDYEVVMPLVWLTKLTVKCLYQPYYCQQLGLFGKEVFTESLYRNFIKTASEEFAYIDVNLNPSAALIFPGPGLTSKTNLLLELAGDYSGLQKNYSVNHKRNIARAQKHGLLFSENIKLSSFQKFYLENINREKENFKTKHEKIFRQLSHQLVSRGLAGIFSAVNDQGQPLAAVLLIYHRNRIIGIINTSSSTGKKRGASHFLFDQIIKKFSESTYTLDFEGSSIPTIARFYEGFGAERETFYNYKHTFLKKLGQRFS